MGAHALSPGGTVRSGWAHALGSVALGIVVGHAAAQERVRVLLPDCRPAHVDTPLLAELLPIELEDTDADALEVALSSALCDPTATAIDVVIRDRARGREARETIALSDEPAADSRARAIALAVAERARLALGRRPVVPVAEIVEPEDPEATQEAPDTADASDSGDSVDSGDSSEPSLARDGRVDATESPSLARETLGAPRRDARSALGPTLTSSLFGRVAPVQPSWALGTRAMLRAHLDASFALEAGVVLTWSHAAPTEGNVDAVVAAAAGRAGYALVRTSSLDLTLLASIELGVLVANGSPADGTGHVTAQPWSSLGAALELGLWLDERLALTVELGGAGVLFGTRVWTTTGTQIDLSYAVIDALVGLRSRLD
ncbi:MAG: hypothetical protein K1X94_24475 [Sandaracinaceae bacterium]|nr:hypothetical protein [Sandaracinaceae bacterium]